MFRVLVLLASLCHAAALVAHANALHGTSQPAVVSQTTNSLNRVGLIRLQEEMEMEAATDGVPAGGDVAPDPSPPPPAAQAVMPTEAPPFSMSDSGSSWDIKEITPDGRLTQRVEGKTRKTWKFTNLAKDRVQVAVTSEGRPVNTDIQLWIGPDWTPFMMKAYSEDGKLRPIQTLVGTRNKVATIEIRNNGEYEFPFNAASNYAKGVMAEVPAEIPATTAGERIDGGARRSYPIDPAVQQLEVVLKTTGQQLNARIELLNAPNNPKQTFECFTNNGELNSLCVCFQTPDPGNTVRVVNLATVEFPCYAHLKEVY